MKKVKLLMVMPSLQGGGAERVMVHLLNHLDRDRFSIHLYVEKFEGRYVGEIRDDIEVTGPGDRRKLAKLLFLRDEIRRIKPDLVFIMMLPIAAIAVRMARVGAVAVIRETESRPADQFKQDRIPMLINRLGFRLADHYIAPAKGTKAYLESRYRLPAEKITVINNPVNIEEIHAAAEGATAFSDGTFQILAVGRLSYQKGFDLLIRAVAKLKGLDWRLRILGTGPLESELMDLAGSLRIADRVQFMGFQKNPHALMRASDLLVLSSRWEGLPNVVLEGLAAGVAIVATRCPTGPEEIITSGVDGALCGIDVESLTENIQALGEAGDRRAALVDAGNRRILDFALPIIIKKYEEYFLSVLG